MKRFIFSSAVVLFFAMLLMSCGKKVVKFHRDIKGEWRHYTTSQNYEEYHIYGDSRDQKLTFENGEIADELTGKKWFIQKGDYLTYGRKNPFIQIKSNQVIEVFPSITTTTIIDGYDTIPAGSSYMLISGRYYRKMP